MRSSTLAIGGLALTLIGSAACQRTELAPECYNNDCSLPGTADVSDEQFSCDDMDAGAINAQYHYTPVASGVWTGWSSPDLPAGLAIDSTTGAITGTPSQEGTFEVTISATAEFESAAHEETCTLVVNPEMDILANIKALPMHCVSPDVIENNPLEDLIVDGTGSGGILSCAPQEPAMSPPGCALGPGNGTLPIRPDFTSRVDINANCQFEYGSNNQNINDWHTRNEIPSGTHVWIVEANQDGNVVHIPFCITKEPDPDHRHEISIAFTDHTGATVTDPAQPLLLSEVDGFAHDAPVSYGNGADGEPNPDPLISFERTDCPSGDCDEHAEWPLTWCAPVAADEPLAPTIPIGDPGEETGWQHGLMLTGSEAPDEWNGGILADRPWVATTWFGYCTSWDPDNCDTNPDDVRSGYVWSAIVYPD